jgi:hypothetical protein
VRAKHLRCDLGFLIPDFLYAARGDRTAGKPAIRNRKSQRNHDQAALPLVIWNTFEVSR